MVGKQLRMKRLGREGLYTMIPLDHGVSVGPIAGIENPTALIREVDQGGATSVILHKGLAKNYVAAEPRAGLLIHISSSTDKAQDVNDKRIVASPLEVVRLGGDAVSIHVNMGSLTEADQLEDMGRIVTEAGAYGLPVLCMMYPRGPTIKDPYKPEVVAHAARLAEELGADIVKTVYTGDAKTFRDVTSSVSIPVLVAGGAKTETEAACLETVHGAMRGGASGVSIGRNVFQAKRPRLMTQALARIVHDGASVRDALRVLKEVKA
jgi:fructose-bisphosphate aldolase / 2-amino-3,7-dideoxy-D-threo-hept-6-ulosonate synthase